VRANANCVFHTAGLLLVLAIIGGASRRAVWAQTVTKQDLPTNATPPRWSPPVKDNQFIAHVLFDQLEGRSGGSGAELRWDAEGWLGTDMNRIWLKSEGFVDSDTVSDGEHEMLYDRPIPRMRYFDAQVGVRADLDSGPARAWVAIGVEGLAPCSFEFAPTLYIRNDGHVAGRINGSYDLFITQRLVVQPQAELNFYSKDDPGRKIGSGISDMDAGIRIRYQISRKVSPYIGYAYNGEYGGTATYAQESGEHRSDPSFTFGIRIWH
jgi:copper resistance protein B